MPPPLLQDNLECVKLISERLLPALNSSHALQHALNQRGGKGPTPTPTPNSRRRTAPSASRCTPWRPTRCCCSRTKWDRASRRTRRLWCGTTRGRRVPRRWLREQERRRARGGCDGRVEGQPRSRCSAPSSASSRRLHPVAGAFPTPPPRAAPALRSASVAAGVAGAQRDGRRAARLPRAAGLAQRRHVDRMRRRPTRAS